MITKLFRMLKGPGQIIEAVGRRLRHKRLDPEVYSEIFEPGEYKMYMLELQESGLLRQLDEKIKEFDSSTNITVRGQKASNGIVSRDEGEALYALTRKLKPENIVETGVCSGYSTAMILKAMETNGHGTLYSVDFPEVLGEDYDDGVFWEGKGAAVVPAGKQSGWLIPDELRKHWVLRLGKTQELLAPLLEETGAIDVFIHDSEHSYECMMFEYETAWPKLKSTGYLVSDDIGWNTAFFDFVKRYSANPGLITGNMGIVKKHTV